MTQAQDSMAVDTRADRLGKAFAKLPPAAREQLLGFRPLGDTIVILRDDVEAVTKGGIIIPEKYRDDSPDKKHPAFKATCLVAGPGKWSKDGSQRVPLDFRPGDRLLVGRWGAQELKTVTRLDARNVFTMRAEDALAVLYE